MKPSVFFALAVMLFSFCEAGAQEINNAGGGTLMDVRLKLSFDNEELIVDLYDNPTVRDFLTLLPLTVTMEDLNRNEKYFRLSKPLPSSHAERPEIIRAGELMIWSDSTLVLFYRTFANSYGGYVRLGYTKDPNRLAAALGPGTVKVTLSIPEF